MSRLQAPGFSRLRLPGCANQSSIGKDLCLQGYFFYYYLKVHSQVFIWEWGSHLFESSYHIYVLSISAVNTHGLFTFSGEGAGVSKFDYEWLLFFRCGGWRQWLLWVINQFMIVKTSHEDAETEILIEDSDDYVALLDHI